MIGILHRDGWLSHEWRFWRSQMQAYWWPLGVWVLLNVYGVFERGLPLWFWLTQVPLVVALPSWRRLRTLARAAVFMSRAPTFDTPHIQLWYHRELAGLIDPAEHVGCWEQRLAELTEEFGLPPRRPITILLLPTSSDLSWIVDRSVGATASRNGIAAGYNLLKKESSARETMRHELTHVLSAGWGPHSPAFKVEGLAVWAQRTGGGKPLDFRALAVLLGNKTLPLWHLLSPAGFDADRDYSYALAGSFTEFLIRTYGWALYRDFYRNADGDNYEAVFHQTFAISLVAAERQWRTELLAREREFGGELSVAVRERRARTTYNAWQFDQCLDEVIALDRVGRASPYVLWLSSRIYTFWGDYLNATLALGKVLGSEDGWVDDYRAALWLQLGELHDLLGEREQAVSAYRRCLNFPDDPHDEAGSPHERARARLVKPFTEPDLLRWIRDRWAGGSGSR